ncbi:hypothetical protein SAMN05216567_12312 [Variovorax sp. OK605]|uniref:hypothetical protein n=1 Tax=Variovorax sp. OK605 TaxID=1855317 RepID=UPI0008F267E3|nr:hypothetical protein [Variovorax sp. OK605]SFQ63349.1 hypothetical protein SAMN05216567_12312 [Variovorax sp. OK605]
MSEILLEGYTVDEVLQLPNEEFQALVLRDEPLVFKAGSADMLGRFKVDGDALVMELAHVDGGGEGALPSVAALASRYARRQGLAFVEWRVHAVHCANPNLKLRRVLERRGFVVRNVPGTGECYWLRAPADAASQATH